MKPCRLDFLGSPHNKQLLGSCDKKFEIALRSSVTKDKTSIDGFFTQTNGSASAFTDKDLSIENLNNASDHSPRSVSEII